MNRYVNTFIEYKNLLKELVARGIRLKYRHSYLGLIWTLLEPLLTMIVLTIVFGTLYGRTKDFSVYILTGRLLYSFFSTSTKSALKSIRAHSGIIKKVYVPKYLYPLSTIISQYILFLISLIVLIAVCIVMRIKPTVYLLQAPVALILLFLLAYGVGMLLATAGVFFRDIEYLWSVVSMIIMYTCAIFYQPDRLLQSRYAWILKYNPLFCIIQLFRSAVFGSWMNMQYLTYSAGFCAVALILGTLAFKWKQDDFIRYL